MIKSLGIILTTAGLTLSGTTALLAQDERAPLADVEASVQLARDWLDGTLDDYQGPEITYDGPPIVMNLSSHLPENAPIADDIRRGFAILERMSEGRLQVHARWGGTVHSVAEGFEANRSGITDTSACFVFLNSSNFPMTRSLSLPGIFPSPEVMSLVAQEVAGRYFVPEFERMGVHLTQIDSSAFFNLFSNTPIRSLEDLEGLKVRSGTGINAEIFEAFGAVPVNMGSGDLFSALQRGLLDAVFTSDASARTFRLNEVAQYHTYTPINFQSFEWCISPSFYDGLPPDLQRVIDVWSQQKSQVETQLSFSLGSAQARAQFIEGGMEYIALDDDEFARWQERFEPLVEAYIVQGEEAGLPTRQMIADMRALVEQYRHMTREELLRHVMEHPAPDLLPVAQN